MAYYFDGDLNDYIRYASNPSIAFDASGQFSISFWVKINVGSNLDQEVITKEGGGKGYRIGFFTGKLRIKNPNTWVSSTVTTGFNYGEWHHCVVTYNNQIFNAYVDGIKKVLTGPIATYVSDTTSNMKIGDFMSSTDYTYYGFVDEVAYFNRELSSQEANQLYQNGYTKFNNLNNPNNLITLREVK